MSAGNQLDCVETITPLADLQSKAQLMRKMEKTTANTITLNNLLLLFLFTFQAHAMAIAYGRSRGMKELTEARAQTTENGPKAIFINYDFVSRVYSLSLCGSAILPLVIVRAQR